MFLQFFYTLKESGVPVNPTAFLVLHRAMYGGFVHSIDDLYIIGRTILVKNEKYFDVYDQVFSHIFHGTELLDIDEHAFDLLASSMLDEWLQDPKALAESLGIDESKLSAMSPDEVLAYFKKRLEDQEKRHDGGSKWIGTGGVSPVGHSGIHPGGLRVGGVSNNKSALKVAGERRYKEYSATGPLSRNSMGEALKRLRNLVPRGSKDRLNITATISKTIKNGGEIELIFDRAIVDRLKVILAIDNGGWSMEPYVDIVQHLFSSTKDQFKDIKTYYFHNTIYDRLWKDASRRLQPVYLHDFSRLDPDTRLIIIGDASMAPYELMSHSGSIYAFEQSGQSSVERLRFLSRIFPHAVWLNPIAKRHWQYTQTINTIRNIFPMYELSLDGLDRAVSKLLEK